MMRAPSKQARDLLADAVEAQGPAWRNAADSVRAGGYGNAWINAGLAAIERALRLDPDEES